MKDKNENLTPHYLVIIKIVVCGLLSNNHQAQMFVQLKENEIKIIPKQKCRGFRTLQDTTVISQSPLLINEHCSKAIHLIYIIIIIINSPAAA